ncbi:MULTISPECIES: AzlD family protein [unclassified Acinetobacter]|uniref:AzlD family protein n=1 Tax=unclassified Acinetobacter TaxID=196816 RepID=UPI002575B92F|nr:MULTISPECIES: AzlD family protein [unclassified Acinetobacter]MDM1763733.1 AzlD family protein [Acinetobacter sp. 226-1]MDM1767212.1 AzlD family protein [Acinetobacter sp. 226-4]
MIHSTTLIAIICVALTTYSTRILGYLLLKNKTLSKRTTRILQVIPGCVLISVIAPYFVSDNPANLIAIVITFLAACYLSLLPTVLISIVATGILRYLIH